MAGHATAKAVAPLGVDRVSGSPQKSIYLNLIDCRLQSGPARVHLAAASTTWSHCRHFWPGPARLSANLAVRSLCVLHSVLVAESHGGDAGHEKITSFLGNRRYLRRHRLSSLPS